MNRQAPIQDMKNSEQKKMHWFLKIIIESVIVGGLTVLVAVALTWFAK